MKYVLQFVNKYFDTVRYLAVGYLTDKISKAKIMDKTQADTEYRMFSIEGFTSVWQVFIVDIDQ